MLPDRDFPDIVVVTGGMAAGKSTVAQALAERLPKSVHLRGDIGGALQRAGGIQARRAGADDGDAEGLW